MNNDLNNQGNMVQSEQKNTIGIVGFVLSFLIPIVGFICSILGLKKAKETNKGKTLCTAGIIISLIFMILNVIMYPKLLQMVNEYMDNNPVNDRVNEEEDNHKDALITKSIDELKAEGYKEYDLSMGESLDRITNGSLIDLYDNIDNLKQYDSNFDFELNNGSFKYTFSKDDANSYNTIENIQSVKYYLGEDGTYYMTIMLITNENEIYFLSNFDNDNYPNLQKYSNKYTDIKRLVISGYKYIYLLEDKEGKYYDLNEKSVDEISYYNLATKIMMDKTIYENEKKLDFKYKTGIYDYEADELLYIISEDNYLYKYNNSKWDKYSNSKVKSILYKDDTVIAEFENNKMYSFDYVHIN